MCVFGGSTGHRPQQQNWSMFTMTLLNDAVLVKSAFSLQKSTSLMTPVSKCPPFFRIFFPHLLKNTGQSSNTEKKSWKKKRLHGHVEQTPSVTVAELP